MENWKNVVQISPCADSDDRAKEYAYMSRIHADAFRMWKDPKSLSLSIAYSCAEQYEKERK